MIVSEYSAGVYSRNIREDITRLKDKPWLDAEPHPRLHAAQSCIDYHLALLEFQERRFHWEQTVLAKKFKFGYDSAETIEEAVNQRLNQERSLIEKIFSPYGKSLPQLQVVPNLETLSYSPLLSQCSSQNY
jgi:hypothetical protein